MKTSSTLSSSPTDSSNSSTTPQTKNSKHSKAIIFALYFGLLALLIGFCCIANKPFYSKGEPREALAAKNIITSGNWVLPTRYGKELISKPPMTYWLMSTLSEPFGDVSEESSRLPSVILSSICIALLFIFLYSRIGIAQSIATCFILLGAFEWHRASAIARVDMPLTVFIIFALLLLYKWEEKRLSGTPYLDILCLSAAVLTKGPVGLVLPMGIFLAYLLVLHYEKEKIFKAGRTLLLAAILPCIWYTLAYINNGTAFLDIVIGENIHRALGVQSARHGGHGHSVWYLYGSFIVGMLPWVLFLPLCYNPLNKGIHIWFRQLRDSKYNVPPEFKVHCFATICVICIITFYSLPASKRSIYLLPAYPFASILLSYIFVSAYKNRKTFLKNVTQVLSSIILLIYVAIGSILSGLLTPEFFIRKSNQLFDAHYFIKTASTSLENLSFSSQFILILPLALSLYALTLTWKNFKYREAFAASCVAYFTLLIGANGTFVSPIANSISGANYADEIAELLPNNAPIYSFHYKFYQMAFYLPNPFFELESNATSEFSGYVIVFEHHVPRLHAFLGNHHDYTLVFRSINGIDKPSKKIAIYNVSPKITVLRQQDKDSQHI